MLARWKMNTNWGEWEYAAETETSRENRENFKMENYKHVWINISNEMQHRYKKALAIELKN